jgi:predicted RNase H-like HicB family nuclease
MTKKFNVIIEKDDDGYFANCPELEGCQSQGDSFEEVMRIPGQNCHLFR